MNPVIDIIRTITAQPPNGKYTSDSLRRYVLSSQTVPSKDFM